MIFHSIFSIEKISDIDYVYEVWLKQKIECFKN